MQVCKQDGDLKSRNQVGRSEEGQGTSAFFFPTIASTHLTSSFEEVCNLGHGDKVGNVGFASGCRAPVHPKLPLLEDLLQLLLSQDLLSCAKDQHVRETSLLAMFFQSCNAGRVQPGGS